MDAIAYATKTEAARAAQNAMNGWGYAEPRNGIEFELEESDRGWFWFSPMPRPAPPTTTLHPSLAKRLRKAIKAALTKAKYTPAQIDEATEAAAVLQPFTTTP